MRIRVKMTPNAKQSSLKIERDLLTNEEIYMVKLSAKPINGEANKALIQYIADYLEVPRRKVSIVQGMTSRWKIVEIEGD